LKIIESAENEAVVQFNDHALQGTLLNLFEYRVRWNETEDAWQILEERLIYHRPYGSNTPEPGPFTPSKGLCRVDEIFFVDGHRPSHLMD
jgi:hypothetical protein